MEVRIKFAKYDTMKFISHLDVMRYFQKAVRRSGLDVAYSEGFNPHQIMSFAAPLGVGQTSESEYFDIELKTVPSLQELVDRLNATMTDGMKILAAELLPPPVPQVKRETAMALVAASSYLVMRKDDYDTDLTKEDLEQKFVAFLSQSSIPFVKKSKKTEAEIDLAQFIFDYNAQGNTTEFSGEYENGVVFYLLLSAGSVNNVKPDTVMEAFYAHMGKKYNPYAYQFHRLETYADLSLRKVSQAEIARMVKEGKMPERNLVPLMEYHQR
ncbi:MAG: DUF2344 domain-containing protein [Lachnospiraceae bacterium]|nr:DUF2344 domain-containing protein [Lachnospiraceae bacterium]